MKNSFTRICALADFEGEEVTLAGWLYNSRASGKIQFLIIRDGTGLKRAKCLMSFSSS